MISPDATWRVYLAEWLTVCTSDRLEVEGQQECEAVFAQKYQGRVNPTDWRIRSAGRLRPSPWSLQLWLPNLKGEFKDRDLADKLADEIAEDPPYGGAGLWLEVVQRGSAEERALLDYSRKMLPDAG